MITGIPPHVDFEQFQKTFGVCNASYAQINLIPNEISVFIAIFKSLQKCQDAKFLICWTVGTNLLLGRM